MNRFNISNIVNDVGETITLRDITRILSDRGTPTETINEYLIKAFVDEMSGEEKAVEEGYLEIGDLMIFIDEDEDNIRFLKRGNRIIRDSKEYEIKNIIHNLGHYEIHAHRY